MHRYCDDGLGVTGVKRSLCKSLFEASLPSQFPPSTIHHDMNRSLVSVQDGGATRDYLFGHSHWNRTKKLYQQYWPQVHVWEALAHLSAKDMDAAACSLQQAVRVARTVNNGSRDMLPLVRDIAQRYKIDIIMKPTEKDVMLSCTLSQANSHPRFAFMSGLLRWFGQ